MPGAPHCLLGAHRRLWAPGSKLLLLGPGAHKSGGPGWGRCPFSQDTSRPQPRDQPQRLAGQAGGSRGDRREPIASCLCLMLRGDLDSFCQWLYPLPALGPVRAPVGTGEAAPLQRAAGSLLTTPPSPNAAPTCPAPLPQAGLRERAGRSLLTSTRTGQSTEDKGVPTPQVSCGQESPQGPSARSLWSTEVPMLLCVLRPRPSSPARGLDAGLAPTQDTQSTVDGHGGKGHPPSRAHGHTLQGTGLPALGTLTLALLPDSTPPSSARGLSSASPTLSHLGRRSAEWAQQPGCPLLEKDFR